MTMGVGAESRLEVLDRTQIEQLLPHRGDILFLTGMTIHGDRHFSGMARWQVDQMGLRGHFPQLSVVPAVFLVEAVAQLAGAGVLATRAALPQDDVRIGVLMSIRKCNFRQPVWVGSQVFIDAHVRQIGEHIVQVQAEVSTGQGVAATVDVWLGETPVAAIAALQGAASCG